MDAQPEPVDPAPEIQVQARALGDPTRHAIFRALAEAPEPLDVAALTDRFGCNHNAVRQHLRKLVAAGLVVEETSPPAGPGRPRLRFRVDPSADARWGARTASDRLAEILADAVRRGTSAEAAGRAVGARIAADTPTADSAALLHDAMAREGFAPEVVARRDGLDLVLHACPFPAAAAAAPDVVCAVHRGIAEGIVDARDDALVVEGLDARDPRAAGCRLRIRRARSG